jgi:hypothetical protein
MYFDLCDWEDESDSHSNTRHVGSNGVTPEEFEEVLTAVARRDVQPSRSHSENMTCHGETSEGRPLRIVFELDESDDFVYVRPITAYECEE